MLEAEIYTTVSSKDKISYLTEKLGIPLENIFYSRDTSFVKALMRRTDGKGVDVALNSLSGELLHATWRCIARWGKMIEIGKRDLIEVGKLDMDVFLANRSYCCVAIDQMREDKPEAASRSVFFS
jgi:NADPH:quinone reductase-like Zn-dependent oxidoreductase